MRSEGLVENIPDKGKSLKDLREEHRINLNSWICMQTIHLGLFLADQPHMVTFERLTFEKLNAPFPLVSLMYIDLSFPVVFSASGRSPLAL